MRDRAHANGFTLLEVMLAVGLLAILLGAVVSFSWTLGERRAGLLRDTRRAEAEGLLLDRLEADLLAATAGGGATGAGVSGTPTSLRVLSRSVWLGEGREATTDDLVMTEVRCEGGSLTILRAPAARMASAVADALGESEMTVRLRYFDGAAWRDTFDSLGATGSGAQPQTGAGGLPGAIEVRVWHGKPPAGESADGGEAVNAAPTVAPARVRVIAIPDGGSGGGA